jgi:hypothetical protein
MVKTLDPAIRVPDQDRQLLAGLQGAEYYVHEDWKGG